MKKKYFIVIMKKKEPATTGIKQLINKLKNV